MTRAATGRFDEKVAVVSGAASGIGAATAARLAAEGAAVAFVDLVVEGCAAAAEAARHAGGRATALACDVSDPASVEAVMGSVLAEHGRLDVVCNIAGIGRFAHTADQPVEEWDRIIAVNLTGTYLMCRAALPHLLETGGNIVNTSSTAGLMGQAYSAAYCASKGGVTMLTKALAVEYIERGVRVNAVAPGGIETPIMDSFGYPEGASGKLFKRIMSPMGFGRPEEIAGLIAFVASEEARYMTGAVVAMDGGITC